RRHRRDRPLDLLGGGACRPGGAARQRAAGGPAGMIARVLEEFGPWNWWIAGLVLLGLEVVAPGTFLLWFGLAAILVGTAALLFDLTWQVQLILFLALAVALVLVGRRVYAR